MRALSEVTTVSSPLSASDVVVDDGDMQGGREQHERVRLNRTSYKLHAEAKAAARATAAKEAHIVWSAQVDLEHWYCRVLERKTRELAFLNLHVHDVATYVWQHRFVWALVWWRSFVWPSMLRKGSEFKADMAYVWRATEGAALMKLPVAFQTFLIFLYVSILVIVFVSVLPAVFVVAAGWFALEWSLRVTCIILCCERARLLTSLLVLNVYALRAERALHSAKLRLTPGTMRLRGFRRWRQIAADYQTMRAEFAGAQMCQMSPP